MPGYPTYDGQAYIGALSGEGGRLADAALRAGLRAGVPACAGWSVSDLLRHTSYVHRWAAGIVAERITHPMDELAEEQVLQQGPDDERLLDWFLEGHGALVRTLAEADPDLDCWTFLSAPSPLVFWARRQSHETAIHRVDAEQAAAAPGEADSQVEPAFAADGVDELIMGFLARNIRRGNWPGLGGNLAIHAEDGGARADWLVTGRPGEAGVARGTGPADCDVTVTARDLYLVLWNRRPADGLRVTGDPGVLAAFGRTLHITWS
jgi:uncharacterized protein (TIGR03083 family)